MDDISSQVETYRSFLRNTAASHAENGGSIPPGVTKALYAATSDAIKIGALGSSCLRNKQCEQWFEVFPSKLTNILAFLQCVLRHHSIHSCTAANQGISNHVRQPRFAITAESAFASSS